MTAENDPGAKAPLVKAMIADAADSIAKCIVAEGIAQPAPISVIRAVHYSFEIARDRWGLDGVRLLATTLDLYWREMEMAGGAAS